MGKEERQAFPKALLMKVLLEAKPELVLPEIL